MCFPLVQNKWTHPWSLLKCMRLCLWLVSNGSARAQNPTATYLLAHELFKERCLLYELFFPQINVYLESEYRKNTKPSNSHTEPGMSLLWPSPCHSWPKSVLVTPFGREVSSQHFKVFVPRRCYSASCLCFSLLISSLDIMKLLSCKCSHVLPVGNCCSRQSCNSIIVSAFNLEWLLRP